MSKSRKRATALKHFATIMKTPQAYYHYKQNKNAFINDDSLPMHEDYTGEKNGGPPYTDAIGNTIRETGVIYPQSGYPSTLLEGINNAPHDHQSFFDVKGNLLVLKGGRLQQP